MCKVSIIMPVYNSEKFLKPAIESVLSQSFKEIELILIDDGSKDRSGNICDEYESKDKRVVVVHQKNQGISKARNKGIQIASGEYIGFMDHDDIMELDIIKKCIEVVKKDNMDIVKFGYFVEEDFKAGFCQRRKNCADKKLILNSENLGKEFHSVKKTGYFNMIWNGIYKSNLFKSTGIFFDDDIIMGYEDWIFNYKIYVSTEKQVIIPDIGYIHYQREGHSTSKSFHINQLLACRRAAEKEYELYMFLNNNYQGTLNWANRSIEFLIEFLTIFRREGCSLSIKEKQDALKSLKKSKPFLVYEKKNKGSDLSITKKMVKSLFYHEKYIILLILARLYYYVLLFKKRYSKRGGAFLK